MLIPLRIGVRRSNAHGRLRRAFTLVELLVVIAIIGILAGFIVPVFGTARKSADKATCIAHLKQIVAASNLAANDNGGLYPNMHGYSWETTSSKANATTPLWVSDALAPYVSGTVGADPTKLLRCPACEKNVPEAWLQQSLYCHYRFNYFQAQDAKPLVGYANAVLFFDTTYPNWTAADVSHFPGVNALLNVAYADGHVATITFKNFQALDSADTGTEDFFTLGWIK